MLPATEKRNPAWLKSRLFLIVTNGIGARVFPEKTRCILNLATKKIRELHASGAFGADQPALPQPALSLGDRGRQVKLLQEKLNKHGAHLETDGDFGRGTLAEVMAFQASHGLTVDGIVGQKTRTLLGF